MSSGIQVYADKENSHRMQLPGKGNGGNTQQPKLACKVFQQSQIRSGNSNARKALGSIDKNVRTKREFTNSVQKPQLEFKIPAKPASRPMSSQASKIRIKKDLRVNNRQVTQLEGAVKLLVNGKSIPWMDDEIEDMPSLAMKEKDDYSDLWPLEERPSTYLQHMKTWRPACLLPQRCSSSQEDTDDQDYDSVMEQLLCSTHPPPDDTLEEPDLDPELIPEEDIPVILIEDIPLPSLDSLTLELTANELPQVQ